MAVFNTVPNKAELLSILYLFTHHFIIIIILMCTY